MKKTYEERLRIPLNKTSISLFTKSGLLIAVGYECIVIGGRGPYIEFIDNQINQENIFIPDDQKWRIQNSDCYYIEYRTNQDNVKIYQQKKVVDYADYKIGFWYISPFDLKTSELEVLVEPIKRNSIDIV